MSNNDSVLAAIVSGASQALLTLLGVDYYAMIWAFFGSLVALTQTQRMTRGRAVLFVLLSTLVGAALGTAAFAYLAVQPKAILLVTSVVGGFGFQLILAALTQAVVARIKTLGGVKDDEQPAQSPN